MRGTKPKHPAVTVYFPLWPYCHIVTFNQCYQLTCGIHSIRQLNGKLPPLEARLVEVKASEPMDDTQKYRMKGLTKIFFLRKVLKEKKNFQNRASIPKVSETTVFLLIEEGARSLSYGKFQHSSSYGFIISMVSYFNSFMLGA